MGSRSPPDHIIEKKYCRIISKLRCTSRAPLTHSMCPGSRYSTSSPAMREMLSLSFAPLPPGKSTRPTLSRKMRSPHASAFFSGQYTQMDPGEWPGVR
ncbi:MAG TPA: hypothetical protein PKJ16_16750 [Spirochaetota bacterium]|nr:hypothetical protein [Spirochaetota bacterium]